MTTPSEAPNRHPPNGGNPDDASRCIAQMRDGCTVTADEHACWEPINDTARIRGQVAGTLTALAELIAARSSDDHK